MLILFDKLAKSHFFDLFVYRFFLILLLIYCNNQLYYLIQNSQNYVSQTQNFTPNSVPQNFQPVSKSEIGFNPIQGKTFPDSNPYIQNQSQVQFNENINISQNKGNIDGGEFNVIKKDVNANLYVNVNNSQNQQNHQIQNNPNFEMDFPTAGKGNNEFP